MQEEINVEIATPKGVYEGSFPKTAKISDVIDAVVEDQDLGSSDTFDLVYNGNTLSPKDRPLISFGLEGTVALELVATGEGV